MSTINSLMLSQETEARLFEIFRHFVRPTFVDVGAGKGGVRLIASHGLRGISLEPLPKHAASLSALATEWSVDYVPFAADAQDGKAVFHIACDEH